MEDEKAFRASMKRLREERGWTQADLARELTESGWTGVYQTTISRMEKGERPIRIGEARGIARVFNVTVGLMIVPTEERKPVEELRKSVHTLDGLYNSIGADSDRFRFLQNLLPDAIEAVESSDFRDWADADMRATIEGDLKRARSLIGMDVRNAYDDWMTNWHGLDSDDA